MRSSYSGFFLTITLSCIASVGSAEDFAQTYISEPLPPGIQVVSTEFAGPTFADANGHTLYIWPLKQMRSGITGDSPGRSSCLNEKITVTAGIMSPYPPGLTLPNVETRPTCTDIWPPVYAAEDAQAVGNWSIAERDDGTRQWAYKDQPVYTYVRDTAPGDVYGSDTVRANLDRPAYRVAVGPAPMIPPGFAIAPRITGRMLTTDAARAVYVNERDTAQSTTCLDECTHTWIPLLAPALARAHGEWGIFERSPGVFQWTFRGKPLYSHAPDPGTYSVEGADVPGWSNVYTQGAPEFPASFTVQDGLIGQVLADSKGRTLYTYSCTEDTMDQLPCDHPGDTQVYRKAICGAGDQDQCLQDWPYVEALPGETSSSRSWRAITIDPRTGHHADAEQENALRVWSYLGKPVYTYAADQQPGDTFGSSIGETRGLKNGLHAFIIRNDFHQ